MRLLVAIVNYGRADLTIDCLRTAVPEARAVTAEGRGLARIALCDNGSEDDSAERLRAAVEREGWSDIVELTAITPNRGFTGGNNAVIRPALESGDPPEHVLLLNNDTLVREGAFRELLAFMDVEPGAGIAGSRLENPDGSPRRSVFRFYSVPGEFDAAASTRPVSALLAPWRTCVPLADRPRRADWVSGASLIIRGPLLRELGGLDEGYYTYFDDIDLCRRARRLGHAAWYVPASRVVHLAGSTTGVTSFGNAQRRRPAYWFEARRRYFLRHHGPAGAALIDLATLAGLAVSRARDVLQRRPRATPPRFGRDLLAHSVLTRGFRLPVVRHPGASARAEPLPPPSSPPSAIRRAAA